MRRAGKAGLLGLLWLVGALPAMAAAPPEKAASCLGCHGEGGQSATANVPSLGAQNSFYTLIQLVMFRDKLRVAEPMNDMTKGLADADLQAIADFFATLPAPKPPSEPADPARLERAKALTEQNHCNVCHRPDYSGQRNVPRIADQREDYLLKTLRDYKSGARRGYDASMAEVVQPLDDAQLVELSYYLARYR